MILTPAELDSFTTPTNSRPHDFLGMHACTKGKTQGLVVRAYVKDAISCSVVGLAGEGPYALEKLHDSGFFEGFISRRKNVFAYRLRVEYHGGQIVETRDPYSFLPSLGDIDLHLFNEGKDWRLHHKLGARVLEIDGTRGTAFTLWAPNARRISVVGDFNGWDGRYHCMRKLDASGIWEIFIPGVQSGAKYKYEILDVNSTLRMKTDPCGTRFEGAPGNAAIVHDVDKGYQWNDGDWIARRIGSDHANRPMSIYEVHIGSWKRVRTDGNRPLSYRELAPELVDYCKKLGFTHVEFMPVTEYPFDGSWGYQVTGFFAPTQRYGTPEDFKYLVDLLHQNNIGVILDWVPAHFPTDAFALDKFDGTALYEHADPRQGFHNDWGTLIFNYGRNEVRNFLVSSALSWIERYHVDGLRVDAVASMLYLDYSRKDGEWIPNRYGGNHNIEAIEFLKEFNSLVHLEYAGVVTIAEESTAYSGVTRPLKDGGLGFDFKWNMGWMHDSIRYFGTDPVFRKHHHSDLTFGMLYQYSENFIECLSHDEVVHGKGSLINKMAAGDMTTKAAMLRGLLAFMWTWPGKKTLFMGGEFGQSSEWRYDDQLDWHLLQYRDHEGVQKLVTDLNSLLKAEPALHELDQKPSGFRWVNNSDFEYSTLAYLRQGSDPRDTLLVVCNFTPMERTHRRFGVPAAGFWREVLNTNADCYGGGGQGNLGGVQALEREWDGLPACLDISLPGNSVIVFKRA